MNRSRRYCYVDFEMRSQEVEEQGTTLWPSHFRNSLGFSTIKHQQQDTFMNQSTVSTLAAVSKAEVLETVQQCFQHLGHRKKSLDIFRKGYQQNI